jgi:Bacterial PH domain
MDVILSPANPPRPRRTRPLCRRRAPTDPRGAPELSRDVNSVFERSAVAAPVAASETGGATAVDRKRPLFPSMAQLLAGHVLRDGEVVLLILKPSLWLIPFGTMRFGAVVLIGIIAAELWLPVNTARWYVEAGVFLLTARVMWSVLVWMGRLYVLTDMRVLRLSGIFTVEIFDCPLRKIGQTRVIYSFRERLWGLGTIEITPQDETCPSGLWQTVRQPVEVHEQIRAAIRGSGGPPCQWK